jgi:hypothetical protein
MFEDQLLGLNWQTQDIAAALGKASALSKHNSDAAWLVKILGDGKKAPSPEEARALLLAHDKDARALCFAGLVARPIDQDLVKRAADMGLPFAQGWMAEIMGQEDRAQWAKKAADQGDARGTCMLALCLEVLLFNVCYLFFCKRCIRMTEMSSKLPCCNERQQKPDTLTRCSKSRCKKMSDCFFDWCSVICPLWIRKADGWRRLRGRTKSANQMETEENRCVALESA